MIFETEPFVKCKKYIKFNFFFQVKKGNSVMENMENLDRFLENVDKISE